MPTISEICRSGELAQSAMMRSMSMALKPGSWATTALDAPLLAPEAVPPAEEVEPVVSLVVEPEPASAAVEPDVESVEPVVSVVPDPEDPEPASAAVEAEEPEVVSVVLDPEEPDVPDAWFCIAPEAAWKPLT
jgi:hypothetical protein